jgi:hypothetical protein
MRTWLNRPPNPDMVKTQRIAPLRARDRASPSQEAPPTASDWIADLARVAADAAIGGQAGGKAGSSQLVADLARRAGRAAGGSSETGPETPEDEE